jgi:hypothetical protein
MKHDKDKARLDLVSGAVLRQESGAYAQLVPVEFDMSWERSSADNTPETLRHWALDAWSRIGQLFRSFGLSLAESQGYVMAGGAEKYAEHNWLQGGFAWSRLVAAVRRHIVIGQRDMPVSADQLVIDPEFGQPHLAHAACMLTFLVEHISRGIGEDDRWPA